MALSRDWGKEKREESFTLPWGAGAGISVAVSGYLGIWVSVCELEPKWFRMNPMIALPSASRLFVEPKAWAWVWQWCEDGSVYGMDEGMGMGRGVRVGVGMGMGGVPVPFHEVRGPISPIVPP